MSKITKSFKNFLLPVITVALFLWAAAPPKNKYVLSKDYKVTIHGTSNLHDWNETVETVTGDGMVNINKNGSFDLEAISIKMEVNSIKSDKGSVMDKNTHKALKSEDNPFIIYKLDVPLKAINPLSKDKIVSAKGSLTIAGVTKSIDMKVKIFMAQKGELSFEGSKTIKMSDYNVEPPTALLGTIKTGNEITLNFKTTFLTTAK